MASVGTPQYSETARMELQSLVKLAGDSIARFWPMRTFIHHNPLHGLEHLRFDEAIQVGQRLFGGRGYLPNSLFREYVREGRIRRKDVEAVLIPFAKDAEVTIGQKRISHLDVLQAHLLHGISAPAWDQIDALIAASPDRTVMETLTERLGPIVPSMTAKAQIEAAVDVDRHALGRQHTLSSWCDRTLGTAMTVQVNEQMIKWCGAFLDEGQATWVMPLREHTLYGAWKVLVRHDLSLSILGVPDMRRKVEQLPQRPEDAILEILDALAVPKLLWQDYLTLHLAALPGWTGFIKWRAHQGDYDWQNAYPINLSKYLAVRLFYERELVSAACSKELGIQGTLSNIDAYMQCYTPRYFLRRERIAGNLPRSYAREVDRLRYGPSKEDSEAWDRLINRYLADSSYDRAERQADTWRIVTLARSLSIEPAVLLEADPAALKTLLEWLDRFPESQHGPLWLHAFEASYQDRLLEQVAPNARRLRLMVAEAEHDPEPEVRAPCQAIFCIDVRSEGLRRHLEAIGNYETFGIAGFFGVPLRYRPFGEECETDQCPVLTRPKNIIREIPRSYQGRVAEKYLAGFQLTQAGHALLHDLKENVITPYVMVEAVGWLYSLPFLGKTLIPLWYDRLRTWLQRKFTPPIATTLTVEKLSRQEAQEMLAAEQRDGIRRALRERLGRHGEQMSPELIERLRRRALDDEGDEVWPQEQGRPIEPIRGLGLSKEQEAELIEVLRNEYGVHPRRAAQRLDRITQTGFTRPEQAYFVETALRLIGLTDGFARLVLLCGHKSTSDNNPYESALDCGACGGNQGRSNARALAAMANHPQVRAILADRGIRIPLDTHFLAGEHDTTTDHIELFDLEDVPPTHRKDLLRLQRDLEGAGMRNSEERYVRFPDTQPVRSLRKTANKVRRRSRDWTQVRPEWGLAGNAAFIIGRRQLTLGLNLQNRVFLHSYDYRRDPSGKSLEVIMTAPLVVAEWINMEHYFSTVDNDVYGSGSKIYHNVTGRIGVMYGTQSDLRIGLPRQTVLNGERPYHEPMRLLAVIEAPRERIMTIIRRNAILQHFFDLCWIHLVALDPERKGFYRYVPGQEWIPWGPSGSDLVS